MTDPAETRTFLRCTCGAMTRADLAHGLDGIDRCSSCAAALIEHQAEAPAIVVRWTAEPASPIVNRSVFRSASLRRAPETKPL